MNKKTCKILLLTFGILIAWQSVIAKAVYDFDGDGKTDPAVVRGENGKLMWYILQSNNGFIAHQWGENVLGTEDKAVPEDYDGDGKWDVAVWRRHITEEGQSYFYILYSSSNTYQVIPWGSRYDYVVPQDYDGDGKADVAVFRPTEGVWYILQSRDGFRAERFGGGTFFDTPVSGDYDGDGKADLAVYRRDTEIFRADLTFYIRRSSDGGLIVDKFGYLQADIVTPGDYDGDGKTDVAVWRGRSEYGNGIWYWHRSSDGAYGQIRWGLVLTPDYPVQGDYDGDGKTDVAVWRNQVNGVQSYFYINESTNGFKAIQWGMIGDGPARQY